ncbi:MAG: cupin domain-containing protein [Hyphomicrobium sp.]|nr:cupin domain-containing protein [Hyphomicrobium sp.]
MTHGQKGLNLFGLGLAVGGFAAAIGLAVARDALPRFTPLMSTSRTVMDEPIVYPAGAVAKLTGGIVALMPGDETGWHTHGMPLTGIILEGELTVDYGRRGTRTYRQGEAIAEAIAVPHNGKNTGTGPMRLFAVFIGAESLTATTPVSAQPFEVPR